MRLGTYWRNQNPPGRRKLRCPSKTGSDGALRGAPRHTRGQDVGADLSGPPVYARAMCW